MTCRVGRSRNGRVGIPAVRRTLRLLVSVAVALILPACGSGGGAGSVHIAKERTSSVMVTPDRKVPMLAQPKGRSSKATPKTSSPRP
jgi:hypothetical protein